MNGAGDTAISVRGVSKRYRKYVDTPTLIGRVARPFGGSRATELWALRDIDLEVGRGECVGVIGRNGSGKSTLLRLLAGVTGPTSGTVAVRGQVAPLIAVGVGFHPELTGRENVYLSGTVLGLSRADIDARLDEIVEFAEIASFIDTPVKFYSSGMYVRLGFAVSVVSEPDVLLVDEVLAVGDLAFQVKSFDRMHQIRDAGTTIVIVSHNLNAIRRLCDRTVVIHDGALRHDGPTADALSLYHQLLGEPRELDEADAGGRDEFRGTGAARVEGFALLGADGRETAHATSGDELRFVLDVTLLAPIADPYLSFRLFHESGVQVYGRMFPFGGLASPGAAVRYEVALAAALPTGSYSADVTLVGLDRTLHAPTSPTVLFYVDGTPGVGGVADLGAQLRAVSASPARDSAGSCAGEGAADADAPEASPPAGT